MECAAESGRPFVGRTVWRLVILFAIGFTHSLFYSGDLYRNEGLTYQAIAHRLNQMGFCIRRGKPFLAMSVQRLDRR